MAEPSTSDYADFTLFVGDAPFRVTACWDDCDDVWLGYSPDIKGLGARAESLDELAAKMTWMAPIILQENEKGGVEFTGGAAASGEVLVTAAFASEFNRLQDGEDHLGAYALERSNFAPDGTPRLVFRVGGDLSRFMEVRPEEGWDAIFVVDANGGIAKRTLTRHQALELARWLQATFG